MDKSIKNKVEVIFWITVIFFSCVSKHRTSTFIKIVPFQDSCYMLQDSVNREIEIVENTLKDTVVFGASILPPNFVGKFNYLLLDNKNDAVIYPESGKNTWPRTSMFCLSLYKKRANNGHILIKYDQ